MRSTMNMCIRRQSSLWSVMLGVAIPLSAGAGQAGLGVSPVSQANNSFAIDFYRHAGGKPGNLVFSPYSISAAFAMTYAGAAGDTASQMQKVMHWTAPAPGVASDFADLQPESWTSG